MTFLATRLPDDVALNFSGGPEDSVTIAMALGGAEQRNKLRSQFTRVYSANYNGKTEAQKAALLNAILAVGGRHVGFLFKDWTDYTVSGSEGTVSLVSGSTYQLEKAYVRGALTHTRTITKPVSGTVSISGGGVYTINYATGTFTHDSGSAPTGWSGQFDVPVRFDMQRPDVVALTREVFSWGNLALREIPLET